MTKWIEKATRVRQLLSRDSEAVQEDEISLLIDFYGSAAPQGSAAFDPAYLRKLLGRPRQQLTPPERADLLAFRAIVNLKAQGILAAAPQRETKVA